MIDFKSLIAFDIIEIYWIAGLRKDLHLVCIFEVKIIDIFNEVIKLKHLLNQLLFLS